MQKNITKYHKMLWRAVLRRSRAVLRRSRKAEKSYPFSGPCRIFFSTAEKWAKIDAFQARALLSSVNTTVRKIWSSTMRRHFTSQRLVLRLVGNSLPVASSLTGTTVEKKRHVLSASPAITLDEMCQMSAWIPKLSNWPCSRINCPELSRIR